MTGGPPPREILDREGDPLVVREAVRRDAPRFLEHMATIVRETTYMLQCAGDPLPDLDEQRALIDHFGRLRNSLCLVAVRPGRGPGRERIVGTLTLLGGQTSRTRQVAHLGMGVRREAWQRGIGSEMLDVALTWARANPILARVSLQVYSRNEPARALYRSRAFEVEGVLARDVRLDDGWEDLVGMSLDVRREAS
ncbi:MAG: GNAT family N-acetyltransferase [Myxococcota bacterium]